MKYSIIARRLEILRGVKRISMLFEMLSSIIIFMTWVFWDMIIHGATNRREKQL